MNIAYPLIPITTITVLAYFTTWLFYRWNLFSALAFQKFWNYLLLITFLVSGLLGLLSVIKINYKLEIPNYDDYLQWHVAFGIGMVIISVFHLSWNIKYYFTFKKNRYTRKDNIPAMAGPETDQFRWLIFLLGVLAIINQMIFIREFICVLSGNELIIGIILACWMLLTGFGAFTGRKGNFSKLSLKRGIVMLSALTIIPPMLIAVLYWLKNMMYPPGTLINLEISLVAALLLLFPVCFLSGYLFTAFSTLISASKKTNLTGKAYAIESLGSLAGGIVFSIILGKFFNSFTIFGITIMIILLSGVWMILRVTKKLSIKLILPGLLIPALIFIFNPDNFIKKMLYPNQELVKNKSTRYGNLVVTKQAGQVNVYENNDLQFYTENVMTNEESIHFPMVQHNNPQNVLLISGGIAGMIAEIEKYNVKKITYLESNPEIFRSLKEYSEPIHNSGNVEIIKADIRSFTGKTTQKYDVIILNLPPPSSLGINRFYTKEFFQILKELCSEETVVCTSLPATANYAEENALEVNSSLWKTVGIFFSHRLLMIGEKNYFLASDRILSPNITKAIEEKRIETTYVNRYYLDDMLLSARSETLTNQFNESAPVNRDFYPYMFFRQTGHWLSYFGSSYQIIVIIPVILFLILFLRTNSITAGLYTGGFTATSMEVALLLAYQVYFGSIYLDTAFFFAVFMAGLAFGSTIKLNKKVSMMKCYYLLQYGLAVFTVALPLLIRLTGNIAAWRVPAQILFFLLIFFLASGIGLEFLLASKLRRIAFSETAGINYSTDLAGSAFGAFLSAIVLLPLLGLVYTCFMVAVLNLVSGTLAWRAGKAGTF
jgi:spermidine synthase